MNFFRLNRLQKSTIIFQNWIILYSFSSQTGCVWRRTTTAKTLTIPLARIELKYYTLPYYPLCSIKFLFTIHKGKSFRTQFCIQFLKNPFLHASVLNVRHPPRNFHQFVRQEPETQYKVQSNCSNCHIGWVRKEPSSNTTYWFVSCRPFADRFHLFTLSTVWAWAMASPGQHQWLNR